MRLHEKAKASDVYCMCFLCFLACQSHGQESGEEASEVGSCRGGGGCNGVAGERS